MTNPVSVPPTRARAFCESGGERWIEAAGEVVEVVAALRSHREPQEVGGEWLFIKGPRLRQRLVTRDGVVALEVV